MVTTTQKFMLECYEKNGVVEMRAAKLVDGNWQEIQTKDYPHMKNVAHHSIETDWREEPTNGGCTYREFVVIFVQVPVKREDLPGYKANWGVGIEHLFFDKADYKTNYGTWFFSKEDAYKAVGGSKTDIAFTNEMVVKGHKVYQYCSISPLCNVDYDVVMTMCELAQARKQMQRSLEQFDRTHIATLEKLRLVNVESKVVHSTVLGARFARMLGYGAKFKAKEELKGYMGNKVLMKTLKELGKITEDIEHVLLEKNERNIEQKTYGTWCFNKEDAILVSGENANSVGGHFEEINIMNHILYRYQATNVWD